MTAVERRGATAADRSREERERTGAAVDRVARWTAEDRARNGLAPRADRGAVLAAVPGLGPRTKSAQPGTPHGFKGLTPSGRRAVRDSCALLAADPDTYVFLTVTLPPAVAECCNRDQLAKFQSRLLFFARRALIAANLPPLVVLVAEIHPKRKTLGGGPIVHWHLACRNRQTPGGPYGVSIPRWKSVVRQAHQAAFPGHRFTWDGNRVQPWHGDPGKYMGKYMSKGSSETRRFRGTHWERCIPKQWWAWSGELRGLVTGARWRPPSGFLRHCCRWRDDLEAAGLAESGEITVGDGMTVGVWFRWRDLGAVLVALESWALEEEWREQQIRGEPPP